tara:strand:- start:4983 stop:5891 length:909 start_codon:yes stop_codon:yes gene_type:complete
MKTKFNRIGIKAIDRGGSNLLLALFHYHDEFFSLSEKVTFDTTKPEDYPLFADPFWPEAENPASHRGTRPVKRDDVKLVEWLHLQYSSVFHIADRHKKIDKVNNIVQKIPRETINPNVHNYASFMYKYYNHEYDKILCVLRNPFRVAMSQYFKWFMDAEMTKIQTQNDLLISIVNWTSDRISEIKNEQIDSFISLEYFITNFEIELPKLINWADNNTAPINSRNIGSLYFQNSHQVGRTFAGNFDPSEEIKIDRINNRDTEELFSSLSKETIQYCKSKLSDSLFDYWRYDIEHGYETNINLT